MTMNRTMMIMMMIMRLNAPVLSKMQINLQLLESRSQQLNLCRQWAQAFWFLRRLWLSLVWKATASLCIWRNQPQYVSKIAIQLFLSCPIFSWSEATSFRFWRPSPPCTWSLKCPKRKSLRNPVENVRRVLTELVCWAVTSTIDFRPSRWPKCAN